MWFSVSRFEHGFKASGIELSVTDEQKIVDEQADHTPQEPIGHKTDAEAVSGFIAEQADLPEMNNGGIVSIRRFAECPKVGVLLQQWQDTGRGRGCKVSQVHAGAEALQVGIGIIVKKIVVGPFSSIVAGLCPVGDRDDLQQCDACGELLVDEELVVWR